MKVHILKHLGGNKVPQIDALLHKLDAAAPAVCQERLERLLEEDTFSLLVAEDTDGVIAGMLTLTACHTLTKSKYWIEDVVVDPDFRGQGIGRELVKAAIAQVRQAEAHAVIYLTSNPSRTAARALYRSEGFEEYETGVFRTII